MRSFYILCLALAAALVPTLARSAAFDCARASLKVDFVICRSQEGLQAIAELSSAWDAVRQQVTPDQKSALVAAQREWIKSYSAACGVPGRGRPDPDPSLATDTCVAQQIRARARTLEAIASNPDPTGPGPSFVPPAAVAKDSRSASAFLEKPLQAKTITPECALKPSVAVDPKPDIQAGDWLDVKWSRCAAVAQLEDPTFLVITVPDEVRLRGVGFYALRPQATAPFGFDVNTDKVRIVIPLHQPLMPAAGSVGISPLAVGDLPVEAVVFRHKGNTNTITWRSGPMTKRVVPGTPDVSVWQEASSEAPKEVRDSDDGRWELRIYPQSYEVIDRKTGDLVVRRAGTHPAFSPTQRFLVADAPPRVHEVSVYDLVARRLVLDDVESFLIWLYQDSIALEVTDGACSVRAYSTLVDARESDLGVIANGCATAYAAWTDSHVDLSIDGGYLASTAASSARSSNLDRSSPVFESLTRLKFFGDEIAFDSMSAEKALNIIRNHLDRSYAYSDNPGEWRLHDKIRFVTDDFHSNYESLRKVIVTTSHVINNKERSSIDQTTDLREPTTRGLTRDDDRGLARYDDRGLARIGESRRSLLERSLQQMIDSPLAPLSIASLGIELYHSPEFFYHPPPHAPTLESDYASSNIFGLPLNGVDKSKTCDMAFDNVFPKLGNKVLRMPSLLRFPAQLVTWPQNPHDVAVISFMEETAHFTNYSNAVLRRRLNGTWFADCRTKIEYSEADDIGFHNARGVAPKAYRFSSGEVALVNLAMKDLILLPADQKSLLCRIKRLRQPENLQALAMIGSDHLLTISSTGDLDIYACPSGKHVISGALLDDELVVYTDQGWFDGSAEAASFVQLRLPGVQSRFPLARFEATLRRPHLLQDALNGKALPPVRISAPPYVSLGAKAGTVEAGDQVALAAVRFYDDGVPVLDVPATGTSAVVPIPVEKLANARQAAAVAVSATGVESAALALPTLQAAPRKGHLLGLTVGDDTYADPKIPGLGFAESDAKTLADALARGDKAHAATDVKPLVGKDVTADAILARLKSSIAAATPDDTLVFGFAGHGVVKDGELLLVLPETEFAHLDTTALHWSAVEAVLATSPARVVIFLDACHSGSAALGSDTQNETAIERLKTWHGPPMLIFAASKSGQVAGEGASEGGGFFTSALVKTLLRERPLSQDGSPQLLRLDDLYAGVKREVLRESNGEQIPWFGRRGLLGDFVMF